MTTPETIHLGFEVGSGAPIAIPLLNLAVTGQTQESGKTTTLEALAIRSGAKVLTFVTKRGESLFGGANHVQPYFRERADWQFVDALIEVALGEKNKYLRQFLIPICRTTRTLKEVQDAVRQGLKKTTAGQKHGALVQLDAYLDLIVPDIARARLALTIRLAPGINVMDVTEFSLPMQMLFVQSALDWINEFEINTVVVIPEAWEFIPESKGSPVKKSAIALVRKGSGIGNRIWVDSQDMAGVDKVILRGCPVWLIGVQREINEVKRNIANIPPPTGRPKPADVMLLERGQFFACFGRTLAKTYVQPAWMKEGDAILIATGAMTPAAVAGLRAFNSAVNEPAEEEDVSPEEAQQLRDANQVLSNNVAEQKAVIATLNLAVTNLEAMVAQLRVEAGYQPSADGIVIRTTSPEHSQQTYTTAPLESHIDDIVQAVLARAKKDPVLLKILATRAEIEVHVDRKVLQFDTSNYRGRIAKLLAEGFFDGGQTNGATRTELKRTGKDMDNRSIGRCLDDLVSDGFMVRDGAAYVAVKDMKVRIIEREAA